LELDRLRVVVRRIAVAALAEGRVTVGEVLLHEAHARVRPGLPEYARDHGVHGLARARVVLHGFADGRRRARARACSLAHLDATALHDDVVRVVVVVDHDVRLVVVHAGVVHRRGPCARHPQGRPPRAVVRPAAVVPAVIP
ncbi:MAG: hypothetical protein ACK55I_48405, partial [bacterium]